MIELNEIIEGGLILTFLLFCIWSIKMTLKVFIKLLEHELITHYDRPKRLIWFFILCLIPILNFYIARRLLVISEELDEVKEEVEQQHAEMERTRRYWDADEKEEGNDDVRLNGGLKLNL